MFEHRLRIFLLVLLCVISTLLMRAFHLQVITKSEWQRDAEDFNKRAIYTETTRGRIVDHNGTELAVDQGCMDACVDYRAISRNKKWIDSVAAQRVSDRIGEEQYRRTAKAQRNRLIEEEAVNVNRDIDRMWAMLAEVDQKTPGEIEEICNTINLKVAMRSRYVQYKRYQIADEEHEKSGPPPWYRRWLIEGGDGAPRVDDFEQDSGEENDVHPIVKNITNEVYLRLAREQSRMPGLVLRPGTIRKYHFGKAGAHALGILTSVTRNDINGSIDLEDELRKYELNDLIGRGGLEGMCESALRGTRGKVLRQAGKNDEQVSAPVPGKDVKTTIDIGLQDELQEMFEHMEVPLVWGQDTPTTRVAMHGAAVVIDVKSGCVRALASFPDYDVNDLQRSFEAIAGRGDDAPLMNRATQSQLEPGSTIKPVVGLSAITQRLNVPGIGELTARTGIECTGYLVLNGRKLRNGRCWTATKYEKVLGVAGVAHHSIPILFPHHGSFGNADGHLVFADALERSCNVYFETCADALGVDGLSTWFERFGLGRETGIGIAEARGYLPNRIDSPLPSVAWFSGIGQTGVLATPIQMANVAATIARNGVWMRPRLVENAKDLGLPPVRDREKHVIPDMVDLQLNPEALAACRDGMIRVVNSQAGTGDKARMKGILVAGKTGTAEAKEKFDPVKDANGNQVVDPKGRKEFKPWERSFESKVGKYSWYRGAGDNGSQLNHAWFIGFAPANDPQVAFSIMIEYGGSGNFAARHAPKIVEKCIEHGYIKVSGEAVSSAAVKQ